MVEFSAVTGVGQEALLAAIDARLDGVVARAPDEAARLPVDRVFTVEGFGTVITGTLWRGRVRTGDTMALLPGDRAVRVRRVQVHGATVEEARAGQRTAVALHGVERDQVERGDWLVAPGSLHRVVDARRAVRAARRRCPSRGPRTAACASISARARSSGASCCSRARPWRRARARSPRCGSSARPVAARGDRFVIRSYSPSRTVGGGTVIDPVATRRRSRRRDRSARHPRERDRSRRGCSQRLDREARVDVDGHTRPGDR